MLKYLRIAVSVLSLTACVLLIALWVRSYWRRDMYAVNCSANQQLGVDIFPGTLYLFNSSEPGVRNYTMVNQFSWQEGQNMLDQAVPTRFAGIGVKFADIGNSTLVVPCWFLTLLPATIAVAPWIKWRFSLRALLIGMTVAAVLLGMVVASD